jgi:O-acetyl-ADP-ribose deacetylase (regulator of RNase III)
MKIIVADINEDMIHAAKLQGFETHLGSITELEADAYVSPANSFGFMDGGIDYIYSQFFGMQIELNVRSKIQYEYPFGEILVGQAFAIRTEHSKIPYLIVSPTMRVPRKILDPNDVRLATRAAVSMGLLYGMKTIVIPGMGTGCGALDYDVAAKAMRLGVDDAVDGVPIPISWREAQRRHFNLEK